MTGTSVQRKDSALIAQEQAELATLAERVRGTLRRSAQDVLAIGADLLLAKDLLGHGNFATWLDREFGLSRRSAEQFMAAARRFGSRSEAVSHLPAGAVLELSAPSVPEELVERVLSGQMPASVSTIRQERGRDSRADHASLDGTAVVDFLERLDGTNREVAAGIAAHVLRRWAEPEDRDWFASCMQIAADLIGEHREDKIGLIERGRTTVRRLIDGAWG